ncbi:MAG: penicillin-binding protein 1A [Pseudomonadota bacterium]
MSEQDKNQSNKMSGGGQRPSKWGGDDAVFDLSQSARIDDGVADEKPASTAPEKTAAKKEAAPAPAAEKLAAPKRTTAEAKAEKPARARKSDGGGGSRWAFAVRLLGMGFAVAAIGVIGAASYASWYLHQLSKDLPNYEQLAEYAPPVTTRVYAGDGTLVAEFARERRLFVPIESIPDHVKLAFVSAEDKTFFEHEGLDIRGIVRAQISNISNILQGRRLEGGSTITQQVAKNFLLTSDQRLDRKLREMMIARRMEKAFTKDHILELYLNEIYLGNRSYGVAAAALNYFDKALDDLTIEEAAYLAAITKGPSNYHPIKNEDRAVDRRNWVIGRLVEDGVISAEDGDTAKQAALGAVIAPPLGARDWASEYFAEEVRKQIANLYGVEALYDGGLAVRTSVDPQLQTIAGKALRKWLVEYDQRHGWRGPVGSVEIADDWAETFPEDIESLLENQTLADDLAPWRPAVVLTADSNGATIGFADGSEGVIAADTMSWAREHISANELGDNVAATGQVIKRGDVVYAEPVVAGGPADDAVESASYLLRQVPAVNGGLIAIDPHTGRVLAMVGGFSFQLSEFNRALQAERQPGSTFKPFVYAAALDSGYTPSSTVLDAPFVAPSIDSWYKPGNYIEGRYAGLSTLRHGIEKSRNTMTARLAQDLGIGRIIEYVDRFALSDRLPRELAISLGSGETTLMRITAAYSIFVNGGKRVDPAIIDRVQDRTGKTIYRRDTRQCDLCNADDWSEQPEPQLPDAREQVMDPRTAYQITSILEGVVKRGTGSAIRKVTDKPLAGKTGTTNDYKDAWFVGFSPDLAAGVFVGFDLPETLGQGEAGGKVAAPIFADFMTQALAEEDGIPFRVPSGIRLVRVNAKTGRPANSGDGNVILEAFKAEDVVGGADNADDLVLDPLSAAPVEPVDFDESDLNGLY